MAKPMTALEALAEAARIASGAKVPRIDDRYDHGWNDGCDAAADGIHALAASLPEDRAVELLRAILDENAGTSERMDAAKKGRDYLTAIAAYRERGTT